MDTKLIKSASKKLKLLDIVLQKSSFSRHEVIDPSNYPAEFTQKIIASGKGELLVYGEDNSNNRIFRNFVTFGIKAEAKEGEIELFFIETTFRLDYSIIKELSDKEADEFARFNSTHNAWPFWRQYVFQTVNEAHLPHLNIPLMSGLVLNVPKLLNSKKKKTTKKSKKKVNRPILSHKAN